MNPKNTVRCRQCGSVNLKSRGRIPTATHFAGQTLSPPWDGGTLFECRNCGLGFRHPVRSEQEYEDLYAAAGEAVWTTPELRHDQLLVKEALESHATVRTVLDVGCYDGRLLASLGAARSRFGVEASVAAAAVARARGIEIVATRIKDLGKIQGTFDAICAVDVIEHLPDPLAFAKALARLLSPRGVLIISTGSLDTPAWRYSGGRYWYCGYPEHISFVSPAWAYGMAPTLGLEVAELRRFSYLNPGSRATGLDRLRFLLKVSESNAKMLAASLIPGTLVRRTPGYSYGKPGLFQDHFLVVFEKRATG